MDAYEGKYTQVEIIDAINSVYQQVEKTEVNVVTDDSLFLLNYILMQMLALAMIHGYSQNEPNIEKMIDGYWQLGTNCCIKS